MKILSALLGIALVVVGGAAIHFSRQVEAGRRHVAALEAQLQERDARIASLSATPPALSTDAVIATASQPTTPAAASAAPAVARPESATAIQSLLSTAQALSSSPEAMARRRLTTRMLMESVNPDIGEALELTPAEADKLLELLATHQESTSAVFRDPVDGTNPASVAERSAAVQELQRANDAELQAMLGSKYSQWQDYNESRQAWQQRRDLRAVLDAGGIPMTDAQSKSLIVALAAEQRSITQQNRAAASQVRPTSEVMARYTPERRQQLLAAASAHLTPQQLEGYRGMLERSAQLEQSTLSSLREAEARARATPP